MKILLVDDHVMFGQGLKSLLGVLAPEHTIDTADNLAQALQLQQLHRHELVLLDWHLADAEGEASLAALREAGCAARIVILSGESDRALIERGIASGAAGFIPKRYSSQMLLAALQQILDGRVFLPAPLPAGPPSAPIEAAELQPLLAALTPRQREIHRAAARGLPNKLIARELGIAEATVKTHLTAVFAALGVRSRTEAAIQAARGGLRVD